MRLVVNSPSWRLSWLFQVRFSPVLLQIFVIEQAKSDVKAANENEARH